MGRAASGRLLPPLPVPGPPGGPDAARTAAQRRLAHRLETPQTDEAAYRAALHALTAPWRGEGTGR